MEILDSVVNWAIGGMTKPIIETDEFGKTYLFIKDEDFHKMVVVRIRACLTCKTQFKVKRRKAYCSPKCSQRARDQRRGQLKVA
jgi:hypothetical protein